MGNYAKWGNIPDRCADPDNPENPGGRENERIKLYESDESGECRRDYNLSTDFTD